ncbi:hypothetical protein EYF80_058126 [Liparis tanakae]|uniref:Uncharacterized protein n=1 Tax=Liparis tanakae TaxID=230148 RepID=A0A4Z2ES14_9TELE|nr:hypothetical protein EYF80_058126 [Liparis tanakae]
MSTELHQKASGGDVDLEVPRYARARALGLGPGAYGTVISSAQRTEGTWALSRRCPHSSGRGIADAQHEHTWRGRLGRYGPGFESQWHLQESDGVARPGGQVGHDVARRRGRDLRLPDLAVPGDVHQPVGADLGPGFPPPQDVSARTLGRRLSPVAAFVVAGLLSLSFFTAVTPIPYSVPGLSPAPPGGSSWDQFFTVSRPREGTVFHQIFADVSLSVGPLQSDAVVSLGHSLQTSDTLYSVSGLRPSMLCCLSWGDISTLVSSEGSEADQYTMVSLSVGATG